MRKLYLFFFVVLCIGFISFKADFKETVHFLYPEDWPKPEYNFDHNPITQEGIQLGRKLFYDPLLSGDSMVSCASCHLSFTGFTHIDHRLSHGIKDRIGTRNTGALINLAWQKDFMWDGSIHHLDFQPLAPLLNKSEMGGDLPTILKYLQNDTSYQRMFKNSFGDTANVSVPNMLKAFSQFMLQFNSFNSKYDKVKKGEETFSDSEMAGYNLFKKHCNSCHTEPLFTNQGYANNGLSINPKLKDGGRIKVTGNSVDSLKFRIPTLRNIEVTYPYMHDGRYKSLQMVLFHYSHNIKETINLAPELQGSINLEAKEKGNLIKFLKTLTDKEFLYNRDLSFPR